VWDERRVLPGYAQDFCALLAAHMRKLYPTPHLPAPTMGGKAKKPRGRPKGNARIK